MNFYTIYMFLKKTNQLYTLQEIHNFASPISHFHRDHLWTIAQPDVADGEEVDDTVVKIERR